MRVVFGGYHLAGDPSLGLRVNPPAMLVSKGGDRQTQFVGGPGWDGVEAVDRGNQSSYLTFRCERVFDTVQDAEAYMIGYEADAHHPFDRAWAGVIFPSASGEKYHYLYPAHITPPKFTYMGCRVFAEYTITGPQWSALQVWLARLWFRHDGDMIPTGERTPDAGQAWVISSGDLIPAASITGAESYWLHSGGDLYPAA